MTINWKLVLASVILLVIFICFINYSFQNFYVFPTKNLTKSEPYQDFGNQYVSGVTSFNFSRLSNNTCYNSILENSKLNVSIPKLIVNTDNLNLTCNELLTKIESQEQTIANESNYTYIKDVSLPLLSSYFTPFLDLSLTIASILFGLYAIVFIEIIKTLTEKRVIKFQKIKFLKNNAESLRLILAIIIISSAIVPFFLLFSTISNIYTTFQIYQNVERSADFYLANANFTFSNTPTLTYFDIANASTNKAPGETNINIITQMIAKSVNDTPNFILEDNIYHYLNLAIEFVVLNLILYFLFSLITEKPIKDEILLTEKETHKKVL